MTDSAPIYLDCNATTPVEPRVFEAMEPYLKEEFGNAGSRTHEYGTRAAKAVKKARQQVAAVVEASPSEVIFTSGATEANNMAILGLEAYGRRTGRMHIISTQIEHKAVLEPLERLEQRGFEVELAPPTEDGDIQAAEIERRLRNDTLLVSVMHVNNETGVVQPIQEISQIVANSNAFFHVDGAQGFGKELTHLTTLGIDLISISGHKLYAPKGIGALIARNSNRVKRALEPIMVGGGQEQGLRPGTLPTPLIVGFGTAAELSQHDHNNWKEIWNNHYQQMETLILSLGGIIHGSNNARLKNTISFSISTIDSEAVILALRDIASISNGSACTSSTIEHSHVLQSMYPNTDTPSTVCRASWCHMTPQIPTKAIYRAITTLA